jgi:hypothetical protein
MATDTTTTDTIVVTDPSLSTGGRIEVWNQYLGSWAGEFEIESVGTRGYRIKRASDDEILPRPFPADQLRPLPDH